MRLQLTSLRWDISSSEECFLESVEYFPLTSWLLTGMVDTAVAGSISCYIHPLFQYLPVSVPSTSKLLWPASSIPRIFL